MIETQMSGTETVESRGQAARSILERYERSKILEIYFSRCDGRTPEKIPPEIKELYDIELNVIKVFLLGQHPHDSLLQKVFRIMN